MKKILLVEDDEKITKAMRYVLEEEGYEVLSAGDGESGLEQARSALPDLILLDIMLPGMDGIEVCRSLKSAPLYKSIPIIMMTGLADTEDTVKGLSAGANDYVTKPFQIPELLARVKSHLTMKELYDTVKQEEEEKSALLNVSQSLASTMDPHDTLYTIVLKIAEVIEVKRCSIIYVDPLNKTGVVMASHDSKKIKQLEINLDKYPEIQEIMETGTPVIINDVYTDPILSNVRDVLNLIDIKSIMAFPVSFKDTLIGTLVLRTSRKEEQFNEREIRFCEVISNLAGAPLKNAYLFEVLHMEKEEEREKRFVAEKESVESAKLLEVIYKIQSGFILEANPRHSFDALLNNLLSLTNSEYGFIGEILYEPDGNPYLKTQTLTNISWSEETNIFFKEGSPHGMEFKNLKTLFGAVITTGKPVISNDPSNDPRRGGLPEGHPHLNAFLGLPFSRDKKMLGMVGIANRPGGYDEKIVDYLKPFLVTCANIIESYRNEERRKEIEEQLRKLSQAVKQSPSVVVITDTQGKIEYVNPKFTEITGYTFEEAIGENPSILKSGETPPEEYKRLWQTITSSQEWRGTLCNKKKNGELYWESSSISSIKNKYGEITHFIAVKEDVTELKEAHSKLKETFITLKDKSGRLEKFHKLTIGRELEMVKLKEEVNALLERSGQPEKY